MMTKMRNTLFQSNLCSEPSKNTKLSIFYQTNVKFCRLLQLNNTRYPTISNSPVTKSSKMYHPKEFPKLENQFIKQNKKIHQLHEIRVKVIDTQINFNALVCLNSFICTTKSEPVS